MTTVDKFLTAALSVSHESWQPTLKLALADMDQRYLHELANSNWLPGTPHLLAAFSLPLPHTRYVLFGESPYPRPESAVGYAFWDGAVTDIWSSTGLSKAVNRATSLRNLLKMLLVAENALTPLDTSNQAIAQLDTRPYCQSLAQLFGRFINQGFLLLNASLVLSDRPKPEEARLWRPFHERILAVLHQQTSPPRLLLFGKIAEQLQGLKHLSAFTRLQAEHPYNLSFIHNPEVLAFFKALHLLRPR